MGPVASDCASLTVSVKELDSPKSPFQSPVLKAMLPVFYVDGSLSRVELNFAKDSWVHVTERTVSILRSQSMDDLKTSKEKSSRDEFHKYYYLRLKELSPGSYDTFVAAHIADVIIELFSFYLTFVDDERALEKYLQRVTKTNLKNGIRSRDYGILGESFFWSLSRVLGPRYCSTTHSSWVKLFSNVLRIVLPLSVSLEMSMNESCKSKAFGIEDCLVDLHASSKSEKQSGVSRSMRLVRQAQETSMRRRRKDGIGGSARICIVDCCDDVAVVR